MIQGESIVLREVKKEDVDYVLQCENDNLAYNGQLRSRPYSRQEINQYIQDIQSIEDDGQLRFIIEFKACSVGMVDLFDVDLNQKKGAIGVLVSDVENRNKGLATQALELLINYAHRAHGLCEFIATVDADNMASQRLFEKCQFERANSGSPNIILFKKKIND